MKKLLIIAVLPILSTTLYAEECEWRFKSATDVATCYERESFAKVQSNYQKLFSVSKAQLSYNKDILVDLSNSQKAWLTYRDSYCDSYSNYHTEPNNYANCRVILNNDRANQLKKDIDALDN